MLNQGHQYEYMTQLKHTLPRRWQRLHFLATARTFDYLSMCVRGGGSRRVFAGFLRVPPRPNLVLPLPVPISDHAYICIQNASQPPPWCSHFFPLPLCTAKRRQLKIALLNALFFFFFFFFCFQIIERSQHLPLD